MGKTAQAEDPDEGRSPRCRGPRPLGAIAFDLVIEHIDNLTYQHLDNLPIRYISAMGRRFKEVKRISVPAWALLSKYMLDPDYDEDGRTLHLLKEEPVVDSPLSAYTKWLASPTLYFIAHLRIVADGSANFGTEELMCLAEMPNIGVLEIFESDTAGSSHHGPEVEGLHRSPFQLSDRLVKGWSLYPDPFPSLRLLSLWTSSNRLTQQCLPFVSALSSLAMFEVTVSNRKDWAGANGIAAADGWQGYALYPQDVPGRINVDSLVGIVHSVVNKSPLDDNPIQENHDQAWRPPRPTSRAHSDRTYRLYSFLSAHGYEEAEDLVQRTGGYAGIKSSIGIGRSRDGKAKDVFATSCRPLVTQLLGQFAPRGRYSAVTPPKPRSMVFVRPPWEVKARRAKHAQNTQRATEPADTAWTGTDPTLSSVADEEQRQPKRRKQNKGKGYAVADLLGRFSTGG